MKNCNSLVWITAGIALVVGAIGVLRSPVFAQGQAPSSCYQAFPEWDQAVQADALLESSGAVAPTVKLRQREVFSALKHTHDSFYDGTAPICADVANFTARCSAPKTTEEHDSCQAWADKINAAGGRINASWKASLTKFIAGVNDAMRPPLSAIASWSGNWDKTEKTSAQHALGRFMDATLRNWIAANVQFKRVAPDGVSALSVAGSQLRFKDGFFASSKTDAGRENLLAFEAGKAYWETMKDKPDEAGKTLQSWFMDLPASMFSSMKNAKHGGESLAWVADPDSASQFSHVFRAQALQLDKPKDPQARREWERVLREFRARIDHDLRGQ
jgi:hypothetical protein